MSVHIKNETQGCSSDSNALACDYFRVFTIWAKKISLTLRLHIVIACFYPKATTNSTNGLQHHEIMDITVSKGTVCMTHKWAKGQFRKYTAWHNEHTHQILNSYQRLLHISTMLQWITKQIIHLGLQIIAWEFGRIIQRDKHRCLMSQRWYSHFAQKKNCLHLLIRPSGWS